MITALIRLMRLYYTLPLSCGFVVVVYYLRAADIFPIRHQLEQTVWHHRRAELFSLHDLAGLEHLLPTQVIPIELVAPTTVAQQDSSEGATIVGDQHARMILRVDVAARLQQGAEQPVGVANA